MDNSLDQVQKQPVLPSRRTLCGFQPIIKRERYGAKWGRAHQQPRKAARIAAGMHPAAPGALSRTHGRRAETSPVTPKLFEAKGETTLTFGQERQLGDSHATRTDVNPNPQVAEGLIQQQLGWSARKATGVDGCQK